MGLALKVPEARLRARDPLMTYFPWSDDYSVGIRVIDNDHKALVEIVNNLHDAIENNETDIVITAAITALARYVKEHFEREEEILAQYAYPDLANHKKAHVRLRKIVHAIRKIHGTKPGRLDANKVLGFLRYWLTQHICGEDMQYVPYLTGKEGDGPVRGARNKGVLDGGENGEAEPLELVTVKVPLDKTDIIRRCAWLIAEGGPEAQALEEIADPITGMSLHEAERLVRRLLRKAA